MNFDDLMRQAGLEAIKDKDYRASQGQEMTSPEQDRYHAAFYFACLVRNAVRAQVLEQAKPVLAEAAYDAAINYAQGREVDWNRVIEDAIRLLGEDAGRVADVVPLSEEQIDEIANEGMRNAAGGVYATRVYEFARAIEAHHGIKGAK